MGTRIPFMKLCPHDNHLLKVPPPNVITVEIRFQHRNFGRTHSVHSVRYTNSVLHTVEGLTGIIYSSSNCSLDLSEPKVCSLSIWHEISNLHCTMYTHSQARKHMLTIYMSLHLNCKLFDERVLLMFWCLKMSNNMLNKWTVSINNSVLTCSNVQCKKSTI